MNNGAFAEICGQLGTDIEIRNAKNGKKYGILNVAVNKSVKQPESVEWAVKTYWFKIHVWNQSILDSGAQILKKGEKVLIIGELKTLKKPNVIEEGITEIGQHSIITINVRDKSGITILKKNFPANEEKENSASEEISEIEEKVA